MAEPNHSARLPSFGHTIWLQQQHVAFVYVPKVACTSWKLFLARALGLPLPNPLPLGAIHNRELVKLPYVSSLEVSDQRRFQADLRDGQIELLAIIREPRQRVLSAYLDKVWLHRNPQSYFSQVVLPELQQQLGLGPLERPNFLQFLQWLQQGLSSSCSNDHWLPQRQLIGTAEALPRHQLWPMTQMEHALRHLQARLQTDLPFPGREELEPRQSSGSGLKLQESFTAEVEAAFSRLYSEDLQLYDGLIEAMRP
jgi:hypothetical protein